MSGEEDRIRRLAGLGTSRCRSPVRVKNRVGEHAFACDLEAGHDGDHCSQFTNLADERPVTVTWPRSALSTDRSSSS